MSARLGCSRTLVHGGFAAALFMTGVVSDAAGRWVDRWGGRNVIADGSVLLTAGCLGLAAADGIVAH